jgi:exoribonuclease-2
MRARGFSTVFPPAALAEATMAIEPAFGTLGARDLTRFLWSSIDNDDSRDLDQVEFIEKQEDGWRLYVGVAHVDWFVRRDSALDEAARHNTTSVYTGVETFPMLPDRLSTDLSSLVEGQKRLAVVVEVPVSADGRVGDAAVYAAIILNKAQLVYNATAAWLESDGKSDAPVSEAGARTLEKIRRDPALQEQLRLQDAAAQALRKRREESGALDFETVELRPRATPEGGIALEAHEANRATQLIEDFMIAANRATARSLDKKGFPSFQRVVRTPKRWDRIVALAGAAGFALPSEPDSKKLQEFLLLRREKDPERFPDLSLSVIKLLGRGEYVVKSPEAESYGHFGLAVQDYAHSTAPNRRYPDVLTQRLVLALLAGKKPPYLPKEMEALAEHCTLKEDDAAKVERAVRKCVAAVAMTPRLHEEFEGFVTGVNEHGTWVRLLKPPVEGKLMGEVSHLDVGDRVRVRLEATDAERGYIDFTLKARL